MSATSVVLRCPHCGALCKRPASFVRAKSSFVCDGCQEVTLIDKSRQDAVLAFAAEEPLTVGAIEGRKFLR